VNAFDEGDDLPLDRAKPGTALYEAAEFRNARRDLHRREAQRLGDALDLEQIRLPLLATQSLDHQAISELAACLVDQS